jgi:hypothetical protein
MKVIKIHVLAAIANGLAVVDVASIRISTVLVLLNAQKSL